MGGEAAGAAEIGKHYDERSPIGDEFRDGQLHMWYWFDREDTASLPEAVHRITGKVAGTLGLRPGEKVLDAGCGPGTTALYLAKTYDVEVTGVTVSQYEIDKANQRAVASGLRDHVQFEYGDFMALDYREGSFDAVLALESLQNAPDLTQVLAELFRVLRPGGRISMSDFSLESMSDPNRVAMFMSTLRLSRLPTLTEWIEHLRTAGFDVEEYTQCGPRVLGRKAKYLEAALARKEEIIAKFGEQAVTEFGQQHQGFFAPRRNQVGYVMLSARKPYR